MTGEGIVRSAVVASCIVALGFSVLAESQPADYTPNPGPLVWPCEPVRIAVAPDSTIVTVCPDGSVVTGGQRNPHTGAWVSYPVQVRPAGGTPIQKLVNVGPDVMGFAFANGTYVLFRLHEGDR